MSVKLLWFHTSWRRICVVFCSLSDVQWSVDGSLCLWRSADVVEWVWCYLEDRDADGHWFRLASVLSICTNTDQLTWIIIESKINLIRWGLDDGCVMHHYAVSTSLHMCKTSGSIWSSVTSTNEQIRKVNKEISPSKTKQ